MSDEGKNSINKRLVWFAVCFVLSAFVSFLGLQYFQKQKIVSQVPLSIRESVSYPIYIPRSNIYSSTYISSAGIFSGKIKVGQSQITLTEQQRPAEFELAKFISYDQLVGGRQLVINGNQALTGRVRLMNIAVMDTGKTIITLISSDQTADLELGLRSLVKI